MRHVGPSELHIRNKTTVIAVDYQGRTGSKDGESGCVGMKGNGNSFFGISTGEL